MPDTITISGVANVQAALSAPELVPPPGPATLLPGATANLRNAMARFSAGPSHRLRRDSVVSAIDSLPSDSIEGVAFEQTRSKLLGRPLDALTDLGFVVPTETLGRSFGVDEAELDALVVDVGLVASVIGRGQPPGAESDAAVERLLARFVSHPNGPVSAASALYQNYDATAALLSVTLLALHLGEPRRSALVRTVRIAIADTTIGDVSVPVGSSVFLNLDHADLQFGSGPHQCPGRNIAEAIVSGIVAAIELGGYRLLANQISYDSTGRPLGLPMARI